MLRELRDVFRPLAEQRHDDGDDIEARLEVLAELTAANRLLEILVRGGNDTCVDLDAARGPEALNFLLLQYPQCLRLGLRANVTTSSRKMVPRSACQNLPICFTVAPVNDPFTRPNSSDSINSSWIAAQLTSMKRCAARELLRWIVRATSSLPTPLSPSNITVALVGAARVTASRTTRSAGLPPTISYFASIPSFNSRFS
jgi:hypothetical protein